MSGALVLSKFVVLIMALSSFTAACTDEADESALVSDESALVSDESALVSDESALVPDESALVSEESSALPLNWSVRDVVGFHLAP